MPCFGKISLSNTFLSQNRMGKGVQEVYFSLGGASHKNSTFWSFKMIQRKSFEKAPHVFDHFLIF